MLHHRPMAECSKAFCCYWLLCCVAVFITAPAWSEAGNTTASGVAAATETEAASTPLPLPKDGNSSCSKAVFREFSKIYHMCPHQFYRYNLNPDKLCCSGLVDYFGMNSTRSSRNCLCIPEVMSRLTDGYDHHYIEFKKSFTYCRLKFGLVVPFYQEGLGYCNGTQDDPVDITEVDVTYISRHKRKSLANWVSRLDRDWLMLASFMSAIVSVPGFLAFLWPFVYDLKNIIG